MQMDYSSSNLILTSCQEIIQLRWLKTVSSTYIFKTLRCLWTRATYRIFLNFAKDCALS